MNDAIERHFTAVRQYFDDHTLSVWHDEDMKPIGVIAIEPPNLDNEIGKSCLPEGTYTLSPYSSPTKNPAEVYEFQDTAPRVACELHVANFAQQLKGCMAPGLTVSRMLYPKDNMYHVAVTSSNLALQKIKDLTNYKSFQLTITH